MGENNFERTLANRTRKAVVLSVGLSERTDNGSSLVELIRELTAAKHEPRRVRCAIWDLARDGHLFSIATHGLPPPPPDDRDFDRKVVGVRLTASGRELWHRYSASPIVRFVRAVKRQLRHESRES